MQAVKDPEQLQLMDILDWIAEQAAI